MTSVAERERRGAYGLTLPDASGAADLLVSAPDDWATWHLRHRDIADCDPLDVQSLYSDHARIRFEFNGWFEIDRSAASTTLMLPNPPTTHELVHPYLASTASVYARWSGWNSFHAGAVAIDGGAWGVIGDRSAGKSSSLAHMALGTALEVLSDDLLVIDSMRRVLTGPRCIDLRQDAARHLGAGEELGVVGARERWRVRLPATDARTPFLGWVELAWGNELTLEAIPPSELFPCLVRNQSLRFMPPDPGQLLGLVALPAWRLTRPPAIERIADAVDRLVERLRTADESRIVG